MFGASRARIDGRQRGTERLKAQAKEPSCQSRIKTTSAGRIDGELTDDELDAVSGGACIQIPMTAIIPVQVVGGNSPVGIGILAGGNIIASHLYQTPPEDS